MNDVSSKGYEFQPIFTLRLAGYLMMRGFVILSIGKNLKYTDKNVFYFRKSPELQQAIYDYSAIKNNKN